MSTHAVLHHPGPPHKYVSPQVSAANTRIKAVLGTSLSLTDALLVPPGGVCHGRRFTFLFSFISWSLIHHDYRLGRWIQKDEWRSHHDTISRDYSTKLHLDAFFFYLFNCFCFILCVMVCCFKLKQFVLDDHVIQTDFVWRCVRKF